MAAGHPDTAYGGASPRCTASRFSTAISAIRAIACVLWKALCGVTSRRVGARASRPCGSSAGAGVGSV